MLDSTANRLGHCKQSISNMMDYNLIYFYSSEV
jgi:hypothetical protein